MSQNYIADSSNNFSRKFESNFEKDTYEGRKLNNFVDALCDN